MQTGKPIATLEGHTGKVYGVAIAPDGRRVASGSEDCTLRVWDLEAGKIIATLTGHNDTVFGVAITADARHIVSCSQDSTLRVWNLPAIPLTSSMAVGAIHYTNAKVLLVGESGVGKTGLAYRLTENCFKESISTDGVWATQLKLPQEINKTSIEREIWLWDFAGQADYRLIHQRYMDETALQDS